MIGARRHLTSADGAGRRDHDQMNAGLTQGDVQHAVLILGLEFVDPGEDDNPAFESLEPADRVGELIVQQAEERSEGLFVPTVERRRHKKQVLRRVRRNPAQQLESLLSAAAYAARQRAAVRLIHDHKLWAPEDEILGVPRRFDEVGGDHGQAVAVEHRHANGQVALETLK